MKGLFCAVTHTARDVYIICSHTITAPVITSKRYIRYTVLSKRKLIKLVEDSYVTGWDDPRMPTLSGIRRRGFPPSAIRLFCERMGISKSDSNIDFGILEDCAREVLDEESPRAFAILDPLKVTVTNWGGESAVQL